MDAPRVDQGTIDAAKPYLTGVMEAFGQNYEAGMRDPKLGLSDESIKEIEKHIPNALAPVLEGFNNIFLEKLLGNVNGAAIAGSAEWLARQPQAILSGLAAAAHAAFGGGALGSDIAGMIESGGGMLGAPGALAMPKPFVKPTPIEPMRGPSIAVRAGGIESKGPVIEQSRPRTELGKTGDVIVDGILDDPVMRHVINNPVIDRSHEVPNSWGASMPPENPTTYIDHEFPKTLTADGKTWDPADPAALRENAEARAVEFLMDAGISRDDAMSFSFWEVGNRVEDAWYAARGIDPAHAEAVTKPYVDKTAARKATADRIPPDVFKETYPNGDPMEDSPGVYPQPSPELIARARDILADRLVSNAVRSRATDLVQAKELGVIGPEPTPPPEGESPAAQAQRDIPSKVMAERRRDEKITMTPRGEPIDIYQKRWEDFISKIKTPGDVDDLINRMAADNNYFAETREKNEISPAHIEKLAKAVGWDATNFDPKLLRTRFRSADEIRAVEHVLLQVRDNYQKALNKFREDPSAENRGAAAEAKLPFEAATEYVAAFRDDWGESGNAQQEFLKRERRREQATERTKVGMPKEGNNLIAAIEEFSDAATKNGLETLIEEAQKTVEAAKPKEPKPAKEGEPKEPEPETPAEWKELVKHAEAVVKLIDIREPAGPIKVPTSRPLRQLIKEGLDKGRSPLARFNSIISQAERLAGSQKQAAQRALAQQMPPELQALVDKTENIVKRMGATDRQRAELQAAAEATAGLDAEGSAYVLGRWFEMTNRFGKQSIDQLFWLRNNWLLSGPVTHTFYAFINTGWGLAEHVAIPLATALAQKALGRNSVLLGEPFAALLGFGHAVPGAFRAAWQAGKTGLRVPLESELRLAARGEVSPQARGAQIPYLAHASPDWGVFKAVADWLGVPMVARSAAELAAGGFAGRFANMEHTLFKVLNEGAQAHQNAYLATVKEGTTVTSPNFQSRYKYHLLNPTDDALRSNVNAGYAGTFMDKLGEKTQRLASALRNTPLRWEFPFLHVPFKIARGGISYSPLAFLGPEMRAELLGQRGGRAQGLALMRVASGTAALSFIMSQTMQEKATGDYPIDYDERKRWQELGIQANSVQVNGWWVSYNRWGPARIPMTIGANIAQLFMRYHGDDDKAVAKLIGGGIGATVHALGDEVGMLAMAQLFEAMQGTRTAAEFGAGEVRSFSPFSVGLGQIAAWKDPYLREVKSVMDGMKYGIPGKREELPPKVNILGEPKYNPAYHSLLRVSPVENDPVLLEMDRLGLHPAPLQNNVADISLPPALFQRYEKLAYTGVRVALEALINHPGWSSTPDILKVKQINAAFKEARDFAKTTVQVEQLNSNQDIVKQSYDNKLKQIENYKPGKKVKKLETMP